MLQGLFLIFILYVFGISFFSTMVLLENAWGLGHFCMCTLIGMVFDKSFGFSDSRMQVLVCPYGQRVSTLQGSAHHCTQLPAASSWAMPVNRASHQLTWFWVTISSSRPQHRLSCSLIHFFLGQRLRLIMKLILDLQPAELRVVVQFPHLFLLFSMDYFSVATQRDEGSISTSSVWTQAQSSLVCGLEDILFIWAALTV